jgi:hypothetical protein
MARQHGQVMDDYSSMDEVKLVMTPVSHPITRTENSRPGPAILWTFNHDTIGHERHAARKPYILEDW